MSKKELGIYVHIPFCSRKCEYCDFVSYENKEEYISEYIEGLCKEISKVSKEQSKEYIINTIYIGGGTPSFVNPAYVKMIVNTLKEKWYIAEECEITIEVNPGTINKEKMQIYYDSGINRVSIGMQSTNDEVLKTIGRIHTYEEFLETYSIVRQTGFKNINIDLMIGLPTQTVIDIEESINKIIELNPEHISMYSLILEEGTNLDIRVTNKEVILPTEETERKMYWTAKRKLEEAGFAHYEISNFAKQGYESKHNMDCWNQKEYIGIGIAAHSYFNEKRYSNTENLKKYITKAKEGIFKKDVHEVQTKEAKAKEYMLLGLRKIEGIKISDFKNKFIDNPIYKYRDEIYKLVLQDLIEVDADAIRLTDKGIDLANQVWEEFV